ncbi:MAG TPA: Calx-beta domain-containing protein, partial [Verrucomicrobiae bacterium]
MKTIQKKLAAGSTVRCASPVVWLKLALGLMVLLTLHVARAQTSFAAAQVLTGDSGIVTVDNTGVVPDNHAPTIAGLPPQNTIWFQWSTTNSGEVELDTIGSLDDFFGTQLDTVLGVYTGTSLATLSLVSANDNLYPNTQQNEVGQNIYLFGDTGYDASLTPPPTAAPTLPSALGILGVFLQPFAGPSGLRFNAVAGTTYYFAVDTRALPGAISLNWSLQPSGSFRFATENSDLTGLTYSDGFTPMLLYQTAETESSGYTTTSTDPIRYSSFNNAEGVLVTITRVAGSVGRVTVEYTTEDLSTSALMGPGSFLINGDLPAVAGSDYVPTSGTLTFDNNEMSKTILIPVVDSFPARPNRDFGVILSHPLLDSSESTEVSPPRVDPIFGQALVRILDVNIDPAFGPAMYNQVVTNGFTPPPNSTPILGTNMIWTTTATNAILNFERKNYRVYRAGTNKVFTIYVDRTGTNAAGASIHYAVNSEFPYVKDEILNTDEEFPLQAGSDYATPDPKDSGNVSGRTPDFIFPGGYTGTLTWGANDFKPKPITFTVYENNLQQFNEDFDIDLYNLDTKGNPYQVGMVNNTTITILNANDIDGDAGANINPPAGAVDELYNADFGSQFFLNTSPPQMAHPGTDGEVAGLALQPDGKTIVVGDFFSYDQTARNCIARTTSSGYLDTSFNPGGGADDFIDCIVLTTNNESVIGGNFLSYNGTFRSGIALVKTNGGLDTTFNPGQGFNGTVLCLALQPNGQVLVGGNFTTYN